MNVTILKYTSNLLEAVSDKSEGNDKPAGKSTFRSDRLFGMQSAKSGIKIFQEVHNGHIYALP